MPNTTNASFGYAISMEGPNTVTEKATNACANAWRSTTLQRITTDSTEVDIFTRSVAVC